MSFSTNNQLSNEETAAFCQQMSQILHAGISTMEGISLMAEDAQSASEQKLLASIYEEILSSGSLYNGLMTAKCFPTYMVNMVKLGEKTGSLDNILKSLSDYYNRKANISNAVKSAVTYPSIMIIMMTAVIIILITKVLPIFNQVFAQLGTQMNSASIALMNIGSLLNKYSIALVTVLCVIILIVLFFARTKRGNIIFYKISGFLPIFRKTSDMSAACQFAGVMSIAIKSGFSAEEGLNMFMQMNESTAFNKKLVNCKKLMEDGASFSEALVKASIFSGIDARMINISVKSGTIDDELNKIANKMDSDLQSHLINMVSTLEPTIIVVLSCITGIILLSVMLPLLGILSGF
ncbi:MAG: type II secretion system F family protein [Eubacteriales bacterium]|nr:type II secretion system F family protein [Eubacteriales bacterium]